MSDGPGTPIPHDNRAPIMVGREHERAWLLRRLEESVAGRGRLVLLRGTAGIGKTALVDDLTRRAVAIGVGTVTGHCYDLSTTRPYGPWIEITRRFEAQRVKSQSSDETAARLQQLWVDAQPSAAPNQLAVFDAVIDFLSRATEHQALCVVLEDIHWSDPSSLDLLRYASRQLTQTPLLIVATIRDGELTPDHPLYGRLSSLTRDASAERLVLQPLDASAIEALVVARYGLPPADVTRLVAMLQQLTVGNALYTSELLHSYEEQGTLRRQDNRWLLGELERVQIPSVLREVIDGRLRRLSDEALAAVQVAAVIGQDVLLDLWRSVCQLEDAALLDITDELIEAQILDEGSTIDRLRFHHALVQEALLATLHAPRRRVWHQRIAEAYAVATRPEPDRVAHHFQQASDPRAVDWLIEAGRRAQRSHAWVEAAEHFESAASWLEDDEDRRREYGWLLFWSGIMRRWDDPHLGLTALQSVLRAAIHVDDPLLRFLATFYAGYLRSQFGDMWRGVMESMEACREVDEWLRAGVFDDYPTPPIELVDPAESIDAHRQAAITLADQPGHPICLSWGTVLTYLPWLGQIAETIEISEALASLWPPLTERVRSMPDFGGNTGSGWADLYHGLGIAYALAGRPDDADRAFASSRSLYEAIDYRMLVGEVHAQTLDFVLIPFRTDRLDERRYLHERVTAMYTQVVDTFTADINVPLASATAWLALIEGRWSDLDAAIPAFASSASTISWWRMKLGAVLGYLARYRGEPDAAWDIVRELLPQATATEPGSFGLVDVTMIQALAAQLEMDAGNVDGARLWIDAHDRWMSWSGAVPGRAQGKLLQARCLRLVGDTNTAASHARCALDLASSPRQPLALIAAHRFIGELELDTGQHSDAAQHLETALALATACATPYERALTLLSLADLNATRQPDAARQTLDEARAIFEPLRAAPALARAADIEAGLSLTAKQARPAGLSPRETEVLRMIAAGRSNKEIGEALFLSVRTVERHITNLYFKLGVTGRTEATAFAQRHHLT